MENTIVTRLGYAQGDNADPLFCDDPAAQAKATTDFCFDWRTPDQWAGALPTPGQPQPNLDDFRNLALDQSAVLGRNQTVTLHRAEGGGDNWPADPRGWRGGSRNGASAYLLSKSGVAAGAVLNPKSEGFRDFYIGMWFFLVSEPTQFERGLLGRGEGIDIDYGLGVDHTTRQPAEWFTGARAPARPLGTKIHIGHHLAFDTTADTATSRFFADGVEIGAAMPHRKPSEWVENSRPMWLNAIGGFGQVNAVFARFTRTFTKWPGETALDPLKLHQDEERYVRPA
ncbi:hypothetical protein [uncultured Sphingomonas sp.]|uniref:hypothetical protein n=1 Tax=uncultured Sphingomonas sp. TaxID=158754 RepID=UPI0025D672DF|nr:hypothetical protein [uncultured Sphingomonas sp.]